MCEISESRTYEEELLSILAYLVLMSVNVLFAKSMGCACCRRAALRPYSLVSVWRNQGFVQSL